MAGGAASAAIEIGIAGYVSEKVPLEARAPTMAGLNAITGARGLAVPFLTSVLVQAHVLDVTAALLACAVATGVGCVIYARAGTAPAAEPRRAPLPVPSALPKAVISG